MALPHGVAAAQCETPPDAADVEYMSRVPLEDRKLTLGQQILKFYGKSFD